MIKKKKCRLSADGFYGYTNIICIHLYTIRYDLDIIYLQTVYIFYIIQSHKAGLVRYLEMFLGWARQL